MKRKPKPTAKQRELAAEWEKLCRKHARPLELGAQAKGITLKAKPQKQVVVHARPQAPAKFVKDTGTRSVVDPLAVIKAALAPRIGQSYSKGGLQYLTDDEMNEQRTGAHRRRN